MKRPPTCCLDAGDDAAAGDAVAGGDAEGGCVECTTPRARAPGAWGKCAVVGLAESILDHEFGEEIDAEHDTVIRIGYAPTSAYAKHVGTRTDVVLARMNRKNKNCSLDLDVWHRHGEIGAKSKLKGFILFAEHGKHQFPVPTSLQAWSCTVRSFIRSTYAAIGQFTNLRVVCVLKYVVPRTSDALRRLYTWTIGRPMLQATEHGCTVESNKYFGGVPITWFHAPTRGTMKFRDGLYDHLTEKYARVFDAGAREKGFKPTSGFYLVWGVLNSQMCSSVDIYGFGLSGYDTHYFAHEVTADGKHVPKDLRLQKGVPFANQWMKPQHVIGAEAYLFEIAMANSMMCVRNAKNAAKRRGLTAVNIK